MAGCCKCGNESSGYINAEISWLAKDVLAPEEGLCSMCLRFKFHALFLTLFGQYLASKTHRKAALCSTLDSPVLLRQINGFNYNFF